MSIVQTVKDTLRPIRDHAELSATLKRFEQHQKRNAKSAILIATPVHGNLGDQAIVLAQREFISENFPDYAIFEIRRFEYEMAREEIRSLVRPFDLIVIDGGGNVGTLWPEESHKMNDIVRRFVGSPVVVFPQTAYFSDDVDGRAHEAEVAEAYDGNHKLVFFSRDEATHSKIDCLSPSTPNLYVPDIVLYHSACDPTVERSGALLCLRNDKERVVDGKAGSLINDVLCKKGLTVSHTTTVVSRPKRINERNRVDVLERKWAEFRSAEVVVTDRLHGMIFSVITGTPCVALDNISKKISQGYRWIQDIPNIEVANDVAEVPSLLDKVLLSGPRTYSHDRFSDKYGEMIKAIERAIN